MIDQPRYYPVGDTHYPSVTTVLSVVRKPALEHWRGELGNEEADRVAGVAADLGTRVHAACAAYARGEDFTSLLTADLLPIFGAYTDWFDAQVAEVLAVERAAYNHTWGYAGTPDLICTLKHGPPEPAVIDIKTSKAIWPVMALQTAAYQFTKEGQDIGVKRRLIVRLGKEDSAGRCYPREYPVEEAERDFRLFAYALHLWKHFNPNGGKSNA